MCLTVANHDAVRSPRPGEVRYENLTHWPQISPESRDVHSSHFGFVRVPVAMTLLRGASCVNVCDGTREAPDDIRLQDLRFFLKSTLNIFCLDDLFFPILVVILHESFVFISSSLIVWQSDCRCPSVWTVVWGRQWGKLGTVAILKVSHWSSWHFGWGSCGT